MECAARPMETRRTIYFDILRCLACVGVIFNHVAGPGLLYGGGAASLFSLAEYMLSKTAVPLFFMISGALLLNRIDSYVKTIWRIVRIVLALVLFTLLSYGVYCAESGAAFSLLQGLKCAYRDTLGIITSYWFLYQYISCMIMLPLLQRMIPQLRGRDFVYFVVLSVLLCSGIAGIERALPGAAPNGDFRLPLFSTYLGMLMLGYSINRFCPPRRGGALVALAGTAACCAVMACQLQNALQSGPEAVGALDRCERTLVILAAGGIFYAVKCAFAHDSIGARLQTGITTVARCTFGAYLVSDLIIDALGGLRTWLASGSTEALAVHGTVLAVFACSIAASWVLGRVPGLRKLL